MIFPDQLAASGTEHGHQAAVFCWAAINQVKYPQLKWMYSSGNGIFTTSGHKAKEKAAGLKNGVWDIFLPFPRSYVFGHDIIIKSGLYIEMKVGRNELTDKQKEFKNDLKDSYSFAVCYDWEDAVKTIIEYLSEG